MECREPYRSGQCEAQGLLDITRVLQKLYFCNVAMVYDTEDGPKTYPLKRRHSKRFTAVWPSLQHHARCDAKVIYNCRHKDHRFCRWCCRSNRSKKHGGIDAEYETNPSDNSTEALDNIPTLGRPLTKAVLVTSKRPGKDQAEHRRSLPETP